jgi:hypothetical protein
VFTQTDKQGSSRSHRGHFGTKPGAVSTIKFCIQKLVRKLKMTSSLVDGHAGGQKPYYEAVCDAKEQLLASPSKSLSSLSCEMRLPYTCVKEVSGKQNCTLPWVSGSRVPSSGQGKICAFLYVVSTVNGETP